MHFKLSKTRTHNQIFSLNTASCLCCGKWFVGNTQLAGAEEENALEELMERWAQAMRWGWRGKREMRAWRGRRLWLHLIWTQSTHRMHFCPWNDTWILVKCLFYLQSATEELHKYLLSGSVWFLRSVRDLTASWRLLQVQLWREMRTTARCAQRTGPTARGSICLCSTSQLTNWSCARCRGFAGR